MPKYEDPTMPTKSEIFEYWKERIFDLDFFIDWGEPSCWACGEFWNGRYDITNPKASYEKILEVWEKAPLQRCHIIPRSLGGSNETSNLFLMCKECHDLAPNTSIPEIFFQWARKQNFSERHVYQMQQCMKAFGISEELHIKFNEISQTKEFKDFLIKHAGLHRPQSGYSGSGKRLTASTWYGLLLHYYNNFYLESSS
jgi:HNH endonuclease